ncbi:MAG: ribbon-helix-helix protein, CopG family [Patescibacteria group bacterium]|nr:ribbon-helix-helix protein, CopG family [Patescibacteria group bacterium]
MRQVINISLPLQTTREVKKAVKDSGFASVSEFFRYLLREWQEGKLLVELEKSQKEIREGKGKKLKSLTDLR